MFTILTYTSLLFIRNVFKVRDMAFSMQTIIDAEHPNSTELIELWFSGAKYTSLYTHIGQ